MDEGGGESPSKPARSSPHTCKLQGRAHLRRAFLRPNACARTGSSDSRHDHGSTQRVWSGMPRAGAAHPSGVTTTRHHVRWP
eukprot:1152211-Prymnesium_polylepis.1